jgi:hypothetical protein
MPSQRRFGGFTGLSTTEQLSLLHSTDFIRKHYRAVFDRELNAGSASEIAAHVAQAGSYFRSAAAADWNVKPLLQYYGVLTYARALILFRTGRRESALRQTHGLRVGDWSRVVAGSGRSFLDAHVIVENGTFSELCDAIGNSELITIELPSRYSVVAAESVSRPVQGMAMSFADITARMPGLGPVLSASVGLAPRHWRAYVASMSAGTRIDISVIDRTANKISPDKLRELTAGTPTARVEEGRVQTGTGPDERSLDISHIGPPPTWGAHLQNIREPFGPAYLVEPFDDGSNLASLGILFTAAYFLGMLVRYYPSHWERLARSGAGDAIVPLLRATAIEIDQFPTLFLGGLDPGSRERGTNGGDATPAPALERAAGESQEDYDRRVHKQRMQHERAERQRLCSHDRITETPTLSQKIFMCGACGKSGASVDEIRQATA